MRHEEYMKMRMKELQPDEEKLMDEFYAKAEQLLAALKAEDWQRALLANGRHIFALVR